ncbi:MAG: indole-3-glycerol phosphate synthase TrpC [Syntrophobacteraceae bacterium]
MKEDILQKILETKRQELEALKRMAPEAGLIIEAKKRQESRSLLKKLSTPGRFGANIIAEVKRGSPSRGPINPDLDAAKYAGYYEKGGAAAISVLTDKTFFMGSPEDLKNARAAVTLPVLRKDFIVSEYQIYEAAAMGADAVLLIVRALSAEFLKACIGLCRDLHLDPLVEVHSHEELEVAIEAGAVLIGINNRDLTTFKTDIQTSIDMVRHLEPGQVAVAESGIHERFQVEKLQDAGIWNFLIGESLVRAPDPVAFLKSLLGN